MYFKKEDIHTSILAISNVKASLTKKNPINILFLIQRGSNPKINEACVLYIVTFMY